MTDTTIADATALGRPAAPLKREFHGTHSFTVKQLLAQAELNFATEPKYYFDNAQSDARRIGYVTSTFCGRPLVWLAHHYHHSARGTFLYEYQAFRRVLPAHFGEDDTHRGNTWEAQILALCQGARSVDAYLQAFRHEASMYRWFVLKLHHHEVCGPALSLEEMDAFGEFYRLWFLHGLRPPIRDHLLDSNLLSSFAELVAEAKTFETQQADPAIV